MHRKNPYDERYCEIDPYWGKTPSAMCDRVIEIARLSGMETPTLLDLGCGEGQNAVYFAQHKFDVTGLDLSPVGLAKAKLLAKDSGVVINFICADLIDYALEHPIDIVFSSGAMQYIPPEFRRDRIQQIKRATADDGLNVMSVLVQKPFLPRAPDAEDDVQLFLSGELMSYYADWEIIYCVEEIFNCRSSGTPHRHAINRIIARRYRNSR